MKIGIISMQRVINYGSFLQSYALKALVERLGHDAVFVDIKPGKQVSSKTNTKKEISKDHLLKRCSHVLFKKKRSKLFNERYFPSIGIDKPVNEEICDCLIIGSDEVFNCCQPSKWGFSTQLFGNTEVPSFSYAASCGYSDYSKALTLGLVDDLKSSLQKMESISVRDQNTSNFVESIMGVTPLQHLDPVLVYDWRTESIHCKSFKNYILVYAYDNRINDEKEIKAIRAFAKSQNKKLISFGVYQRWCDRNIICSPLELLKHFQDADYVITDTFHGTVLSIKLNKQFATIVRDSNRNKLHDLLSKFNLQDREVSSIDHLEKQVMVPIDYIPVNDKIDVEAKRTIAYLQESIHKALKKDNHYGKSICK